MVARANVSFSAGGASYRLDGTRRDDDSIALDISCASRATRRSR